MANIHGEQRGGGTLFADSIITMCAYQVHIPTLVSLWTIIMPITGTDFFEKSFDKKAFLTQNTNKFKQKLYHNIGFT
jgi:hypothetical protein